MLNIYAFIVETIAVVRPVVEQIARKDPDLGRQLRRSLPSVALNVAEGSGSRGRNRAARYHNALGSAREVVATFDVAVALGYVAPFEVELLRRFDRIIGTLVRVARAG